MRLFRRISNQFNKEMRAYYKMCRKHRKELIKLVKEGADFDWCYLHDLVMTKIKHMHEYYSAGNNVWQSDETKLPTIHELKHVLDLQEELDGLQDKYFPKPIGYTIEDGKLIFEDDPTRSERIEAMEKKRNNLYTRLYKYIGDHLQGWWD